MVLSEFKAWFSGYTEAMDGRPSEKQWARIKEQVAKIDGTPVTREVFIDRYRYFDWARPYWGSTPSFLTGTANGGIPLHGSYSANSPKPGDTITLVNDTTRGPEDLAFDSLSAMLAVGKADALADA